MPFDADPVYFIAYKKSPNAIIGQGEFQEISGLSFQTFKGSKGVDAKPWNLYFANAQTNLMTSNGFVKQVSNIK